MVQLILKSFLDKPFSFTISLVFYKVSCEGPRQVRRKFQSAKKLHIFKCLYHLAFLIFVHRFLWLAFTSVHILCRQLAIDHVWKVLKGFQSRRGQLIFAQLLAWLAPQTFLAINKSIDHVSFLSSFFGGGRKIFLSTWTLRRYLTYSRRHILNLFSLNFSSSSPKR